MEYTHLTEDERYQIYEWSQEGRSIIEIGKGLGRHKSTISRELKRNTGQRGYRPKQAQALARERSLNCANAPRVTEGGWRYAREKLLLDWSPEQIAGRAKVEGMAAISHETIYRRVYEEKAAGGQLWFHLRCQKKRRKRYGSARSRRGQIPNRVSIEQRPAIIDQKARVGDWEGDTVIGGGHQHALVTVVERKSQYAVIAKVERKTSGQVSDALIRHLAPFQALVHSVTFDNGLEFAEHERVASALEMKTYFADPYCSWQRGLNEQVNGLIRQYFPKGSKFDKVTDEDVEFAMERLNHRPRKLLDYKTPAEVMQAAAKRKGVALRG